MSTHDSPTLPGQVKKRYAGAELWDCHEFLEIVFTDAPPKGLVAELRKAGWSVAHDTDNYRRVSSPAAIFEAQNILQTHCGEPIE